MNHEEILSQILRDRMAAIRENVPNKLDTFVAEIDQFRSELSTAFDWRVQFQRHPWLVGGLVFAAGYWLVPRAAKQTVIKDSQLAELAAILRPAVRYDKKTAAAPEASWLQTAVTNVGSMLFGLGGQIAMKTAVNWLKNSSILPAFFPPENTTSEFGQPTNPQPLPQNFKTSANYK